MKSKKGFSKKQSQQQIDDNFQIRYLDIIRIIDASDCKRFEQLAAKVDLNSLQAGNKPFIYHAIQKNDLTLITILLDHEIDLNIKYHIDLNMEKSDEVLLKEMNPLEYAKFLDRNEAFNIIDSKLKEPSLEERWLKVVGCLDLNQIDEFRMKFRKMPQNKDLLHLGLIKAAELGSNRLIDYFISINDVDINCVCQIKGIKLTPLLQAISSKKNETAKYLIFRKADIHQKGEYGDALVTAVHFESSNDLITLILEKGASLASRHNHWPTLNLREYCIQMNKIQAKYAIDNFVFRLIANGDYNKLKNLADNGYVNINVTNRFKKTGRDLAVERSHINIIQLIDKIEEKQRRLRTKMNY